jgi:TetR/AcrR family transcriptional repressor of bet genes
MAKKRDEEGMKSRLMQAAMAAFSKKGLGQCTMEDVAKEASIAKGTTYLYFKSKEQLMVLMYEHYTTRLLKSQVAFVDRAGEIPARKLLDLVCQNFLKEALRYRRTFGLWFQFLALSSSPQMRDTVKRILANNYRGHSAYIEAIIERGVQAGEFQPQLNKRAIAAAFSSVLEGLLIRDYADKSMVAVEEDYRATMSLILDGIARKST